METDGEHLRATNVIVATGAYQRPTPSELAAAAPPGALQLHTSEYRNPEQLAPGPVLIVGSGQSGCQITDELNQAGRTTYLAVGRCPWFPRRYRGRELMRWAIDIGMADETVDRLPSPAGRFACNPPISGNDGGHDCHPRWLARRGTVLLGRLQGFREGAAQLAPGLEETLAWSDEFVATLKRRFDDYVRESGIDVPEADPEEEPVALPQIAELDLSAAGIATILWANGYRPDLSWIDLPLADPNGWPAPAARRHRVPRSLLRRPALAAQAQVGAVPRRRRGRRVRRLTPGVASSSGAVTLGCARPSASGGHLTVARGRVRDELAEQPARHLRDLVDGTCERLLVRM